MFERSTRNESSADSEPGVINSTINFEKLCEIVAELRGPGGCPWDREQTHESLLPALIEEAYEVTEAAREKNDAHFREELGDLLLLVVMHAEIASETDRFNIDDVVRDISEKLIRRHPHVFGTSDACDSGAALMRAQKAQSKAARVNFDWTDVRDVVAKLEEELRELKQAMASADPARIEEEIGDVLFAVVNLARKCRLDAESALQRGTNKFVTRFNRLEDQLQRQGKRLGDVDLAEMDAIWDEIKKMRNDQ